LRKPGKNLRVAARGWHRRTAGPHDRVPSFAFQPVGFADLGLGGAADQHRFLVVGFVNSVRVTNPFCLRLSVAARFVNHYRQVTGDRSKSRDWQAKARNWIDDDANKAAPDKSVVGAAKRLQGNLALSDRHWDGILSTYVNTGHWTRHVDQCGSEPPSPDCRAPRHLLIKHGIIKENAA
jgi:hypothetical protein